MASDDFSGDLGPSQCIGNLLGSTAGVVSFVALNVFSHGVTKRVSFCKPSMYLMYASECNTRCGRGGTVTNNGSATGADKTIFGQRDEYDQLHVDEPLIC